MTLITIETRYSSTNVAFMHHHSLTEFHILENVLQEAKIKLEVTTFTFVYFNG